MQQCLMCGTTHCLDDYFYWDAASNPVYVTLCEDCVSRHDTPEIMRKHQADPLIEAIKGAQLIDVVLHVRNETTNSQ